MATFSQLWKYLHGDTRTAQGEAQSVGSQVHKEIELYLLGLSEVGPSKVFQYWLQWFNTKTSLLLMPEITGTHENIRGRMDAVSSDGHGYDWKIVSKLSNKMKLQYELQAATYFLLFPTMPKITFVEIKKSKTKDGGAQTQEYTVVRSQLHTQTILQLFNNMERELQGEYLAPEWKDLYYIESVFCDALDLDFLLS